jgi:hypothetical protein
LSPDGTTLVLFFHAQCPCSPATIDEVRSAQAHGWSGVVHLVMVAPPDADDEWHRGPVWDAAAQLANTTIYDDSGGRLARRYGAATSGHALLFDSSGRLLFTGGLTPTRGTAADGAVLLAADRGEFAQRPVYGCPLFDDSPEDAPQCPLP